MRSAATERLLRYGPAVAGMIAVTTLSLLPAACFRGVESSLPRIQGLDKVVHGLMYAGLTAACLHAVSSERRARLGTALATALTSAAYGAAMEVCQKLLTTTRHMDPYDALANAVGAFVCALAAHVWARRIASKREIWERP